MTSFQHLPFVLKRIIWRFAYPGDINHDPLRDIWCVLEHHRCVPAFFMTDRIPWRGCKHMQLYDVWPLNPFKKGNPYLPTTVVEARAIVFADTIVYCLEQLTPEAYRSMGTYRGHMRNKMFKFTRNAIFKWNTLCTELFMRYPGIEKIENYKPGLPWVSDLLNQFTEAVGQSLLVTPLAVVMLL